MWRALETKISAENGDKETDKLLKMMDQHSMLTPTKFNDFVLPAGV